MVKGCASKALKFIFFTFNLLFFLAGLALVAASVWLRVDGKFQQQVTEILTKNDVNIPPPDGMYIGLYIVIAIGAIMVITGFFGCCGAWCESTCMLGLFFSVVLTLFCVQIAGAAFVYFKQEDIRENLRQWAKDYVLPPTIEDDQGELAKSVYSIYDRYECCGASGCNDYVDLRAQPPPLCQCDTSPNREGCVDKVYKDFRDNWPWALLGLGVILVIELVAMILSCCLCNSIRQVQYYEYY